MNEVNEKKGDGGAIEARWLQTSETWCGETISFFSTRFGDLQVAVEQVLDFPEGFVGFPEQKRYAVLGNPSGGPFLWLQSVDEPSLAFVAVEPEVFFEGYDVPVTKDELDPIRIEDSESAVVLVILVVPPGDPKGITANLQGPIIVNPAARLAKQLVLQVPGYNTRHPVFGESDRDRNSDAVEALQGGN